MDKSEHLAVGGCTVAWQQWVRASVGAISRWGLWVPVLYRPQLSHGAHSFSFSACSPTLGTRGLIRSSFDSVLWGDWACHHLLVLAHFALYLISCPSALVPKSLLLFLPGTHCSTSSWPKALCSVLSLILHFRWYCLCCDSLFPTPHSPFWHLTVVCSIFWYLSLGVILGVHEKRVLIRYFWSCFHQKSKNTQACGQTSWCQALS